MSTEEEAAAKAAVEADAKPVTMAELKALLADHNTRTNAAFADHGKRLKKDFEKQIASLKPAAPAEGEGHDADQGGKQPEGAKPSGGGAPVVDKKPEANPEVEALRKELARIQRKQEQAEQAAKAEQRRRVESEGYQSFRSALTGKVVAGSEDIVLSSLRGRNAISILEDGSVRLKLGGKDEPEDGFDLAEGISTYLKSNEAKFFIPAPNSGTNGMKRPNGSAGGNDPMSRLADKTGKSFDELL